MSLRSQPSDHFYKVVLRHGRATGRRPIDAAPDVKKDCATRSGHRRIGIVSDLDQPVIGKISRAHLFVSVIVRRTFRINYDVAIVIGRTRIIAPNVCVRDLMIRIVCAGRQLCVVSKDLSDRENSRRRAAVSFFFAKTWLVLTQDPGPPCKTTLSELHRKRPAHNPPLAAARTLEQAQLAAHRIPRRRGAKDELRAIIGKAVGKCMQATDY